MLHGDETQYSSSNCLKLLLVQQLVIRANYATYDMQHNQDTIDPTTHANIMILSGEESDDGNADKHSYWYTRVVRIFQATVRYRNAMLIPIGCCLVLYHCEKTMRAMEG